MPINNADISTILNQVADLLEIEDANPFRVRAYRNAAATIERHPQSLAEMVNDEADLTELQGIGEDIADKIEEIVSTGTLQQLEDLEEIISPELAELMSIPGLGSKRVQQLHTELGITTIEELKQAAERGEIQEVQGFGEKTEQNILDNISKVGEKRMRLFTAEQIVGPLVDYLEDHDAVNRTAVAGSYRRHKETVGDLDIVVVSDNGEAVIEHFVNFEDVDEVVSQGETRSTVVLRSGLQVDIRVVKATSFGAALHYFTGSKSHNVALRNMALDRNLKINEYGIWDGDKQVAGSTEEEMYRMFDMPVVPPELRENRGEIEAAQEGNLPDLVRLRDMRGDLHSHSTYSDGQDSLEEMAQAAIDHGYDYLAITDHSPNTSIARGMDADQLVEQIDRIDELNDGFDGFRLLKSCEVDILEDGSLDMPDDILARLDLCICSIHTYFSLSRKKQTKRILHAMENPHFNILGHPTGRRLGEREPMDIDMDRVFQTALERGCYVEINADPSRLDLDDHYARRAKEIGLKVAISTDSHQAFGLKYMRYGVYQARRGWLHADDVLNTRSWPDLRDLLKRE